jgi:CRISPR-associated protein Cas6
VIDVLFPLRGCSVHVGYQYPLYAAFKTRLPDVETRHDLFVGPLEHVRPVRNLLLLNRGSRWRFRVPDVPVARTIAAVIADTQLRVSEHLISVGRPMVLESRVDTLMHAEMICVRSINFRNGKGCPDHREFCGWLGDKLRRRLKAQHARFRLGRRRRIAVRDSETFGFPVEVTGLTRQAATRLVQEGLGGRKHMGASMWLPGLLPTAWESRNDRWMSAS